MNPHDERETEETYGQQYRIWSDYRGGYYMPLGKFTFVSLHAACKYADSRRANTPYHCYRVVDFGGRDVYITTPVFH